MSYYYFFIKKFKKCIIILNLQILFVVNKYILFLNLLITLNNHENL